MSIREWIRELEIGGTPTFSFSTVRRFFPNITEQSIKNDLFRLSTQKIIVPVYRGFYVIMPPQYAAKGIIPPIYYIDQLMSYLDKPYYISLSIPTILPVWLPHVTSHQYVVHIVQDLQPSALHSNSIWYPFLNFLLEETQKAFCFYNSTPTDYSL